MYTDDLNYDGLEWKQPFISTEPISTTPVYYVHNMVDSETGEDFSWIVRVLPNELDQCTASAVAMTPLEAWTKAHQTIAFTDLAKEEQHAS